MTRFRRIDLRTCGAVAGAVLHVRPDVEPRALLALCRRLAALHPDVPGARRRVIDAAIGASAGQLLRAEHLLHVFLLRGLDCGLPAWARAAFTGFLSHRWLALHAVLPAPHPWLVEERARRARVAANRSTGKERRA